MKLISKKLIFFFLLVGCSLMGPGSELSEGPNYEYIFKSYGVPEIRYMANAEDYLVEESLGACLGFPRIAVKTNPGHCVGLVHKGIRYPRSIMFYDHPESESRHLWIADLGGWGDKRGSIRHLEINEAWEVKERIYFGKNLTNPHHLELGPDGLIYVGLPDRIFRFDPLAKNIEGSAEDVITGLPGWQNFYEEKARHPLVAFTFDQEGDLYVNVGSESDNCEQDRGKRICAEAEGRPDAPARGLVRRYFARDGYQSFDVFSTGLRNSMALEFHPESGKIFQVENARDDIQKVNPLLDKNLHPVEELNVLEAGKNYGWPYCFDQNLRAPEFPDYPCEERATAPLMNLPAHAAPLGMTLDGNKLLITYHGYHRLHGHRLVSIDLDQDGNPISNPKDLIWGWGETIQNKKGAPVGITVGRDGEYYLTDDKNQLVLIYGKDDVDNLNPEVDKRLAEAEKEGLNCDLDYDQRNQYSEIQHNINQVCLGCHDRATSTLEFFADACNVKGAEALVRKMIDPVRPMPPFGEDEDSRALRLMTEEWISEWATYQENFRRIDATPFLTVRSSRTKTSTNKCGELIDHTPVVLLEDPDLFTSYIRVKPLYQLQKIEQRCGENIFVHKDYLKPF